MRPRQLPVGTRFIFTTGAASWIYEGTIKEWSPSGRRVRIKYSEGGTLWHDEYETGEIEITEVLRAVRNP